MNHNQEENWVTGKTHTRSASAYRTSIWTPVDEGDLDNNRQKYIDAGWKSYCWTKGYGGGDKHFLSKLPKDEFKELIYVKMNYSNFCLFYDIHE
jgi:hypothetical protein